mmetsp:Transcript_18585/g.33773  ORF Transcript_18585/g.33773 Transcript_18585/m.33773 type:complete len:255 (+) Transcript_18585:63-827(+)
MGNPYLVLYNVLLFIGWAYCLYVTIDVVYLKGQSFIVVPKDVNTKLWKEIQIPLKWVQTAAFLEVVHSLVGLVRSPVLTTVMQVMSRNWILWGIVNLMYKVVVRSAGIPIIPLEIAQRLFGANAATFVPHLSLTTLILAWSITEVIRYSFFACKELGWIPSPLMWLRYSSFLLLYPFGVASEMSMVLLAWPALKSIRPWSLDMPNLLNFPFDYPLCCLLGVFLYLPGFPQLFMYMVSQRKKVLSGIKKSVKKQQ